MRLQAGTALGLASERQGLGRDASVSEFLRDCSQGNREGSRRGARSRVKMGRRPMPWERGSYTSSISAEYTPLLPRVSEGKGTIQAPGRYGPLWPRALL